MPLSQIVRTISYRRSDYDQVFAELAFVGPLVDYLRFRCNGLDDAEPITGIAGEVVVKQLSDEVLAIILDVARAGNLALTSSIGDCVRITDRSSDPKVLQRWPDAETLSSVVELRSWLQDTIGGSQVYLPS